MTDARVPHGSRSSCARHCGLHFGAESRFLLERRLARRMRELDDRELRRLPLPAAQRHAGATASSRSSIDELTTNETYFFRERSQLRALDRARSCPSAGRARASAARGAGQRSGRRAARAARSRTRVVMLALEAGFEPGRDLRVYASDISRQMLQKARRGELPRGLVPRDRAGAAQEVLRARRTAPGRISDDVKKHVDFIAPEPDRPRAHRAARRDGRDPVPQRDHLLRHRDARRDVIATFEEQAPAGRLPAARPLRVADQRDERASSCATCATTSSTASPLPGRGARDPWHAAARAPRSAPDGRAAR